MAGDERRVEGSEGQTNEVPEGVPGDDGFLSRKFLLAAGGGLILTGISSAGLFTGFLSADQWVGFMEWIWTAIWGLYAASNVTEKLGLRRSRG